MTYARNMLTSFASDFVGLCLIHAGSLRSREMQLTLIGLHFTNLHVPQFASELWAPRGAKAQYDQQADRY
jgi:hypothetical protein